MKQLWTLIAAGSLLASASTAVSGLLLNDRNDWESFPDHHKLIYVGAMLDSYWVSRGGKEDEAQFNGLNRCLDERQLSDRQIVEAISTYYVTHADEWDLPANVVFSLSIINGVCVEYMNEERAKFGLHSWPAPE